MKRGIFVVLLCLLAASGWAALTSIEVIQAQGYNSTYDPTLGELTWNLGASATLYDDVGGSYYDGDVEVTATFSGMTDNSSGGWAEADFSIGVWEIAFTTYGGSINGVVKAGKVYHEVEGTDHPVFGKQKPNQLFGDCLVQVLSYDFGTLGGGSASWDNGDASLTAKLKSETILPITPAFTDYDIDSYSANTTTVWLYSDETIIPEPMTICLLSFGALALRKRK